MYVFNLCMYVFLHLKIDLIIILNTKFTMMIK